MWKVTKEEWRNHEKFDEYAAAADDMFNRTNRDCAPWVLIGGNNKRHARIIVLKETIKHVEKELGR